MSTAVLLIAASHFASSGSVQWLWWHTVEDCLDDGSESSAWHVEWAPADECLPTKALKDSDPVRAVSLFHELGEYDARLRCIDPGGGSNFNAKDDFVQIAFYNTDDGSCQGEPRSLLNFSNNECGANATAAARFKCSNCAWVFMNESPPPYFVQAIGVFVFLVACILLNIYLQDHFDRLIKVLPYICMPCLIKPKRQLSEEEIVPGVTVILQCKTNFCQAQKRIEERDRLDSAGNEDLDPLHVVPLQPLQEVPLQETDRMYTPDYPDFDSSGKFLESSTKRSDLDSSQKQKVLTGTAKLSLDIVELLNTDNGSSPSSTLKGAGRGSFTRRGGRQLRDSSFNIAKVSHTDLAEAAKTTRPRRSFHAARSNLALQATNSGSRSPLLPSGTMEFDGSPGTESLLSPHSTGGTPGVKNRNRGESFASRLTVNTDVVETYSEHQTAHRPLISPLRVCVVCGVQSRNGESKRNVFKCIECKGKSKNPLLARVEERDEDLQNITHMGLLGEFAEVLAKKDDQVYLAFRNVRAWVLMSSLQKAVNQSKIDKDKDKDRDPLQEPRALYPNDPGPNVRIEDEDIERLILRLACSHGFRVTHYSDDVWVAIRMQTPVCCWVSRKAVRKQYDWGGQYVRVAGKKEFKAASREKWTKWWSDFELCVGELMMIKRDEEDVTALEAVVQFKGSATLVVPCEALMSCTQDEHDSEYLITPQKVSKRTMMAVFVASAPPLLAAKGLFLLCFFIYSVVTALSDGHAGRAKKHGRWEAYEEVYFKLFNSGYPTLMADCGSVTLYFVYSFRPNLHQFIAGVGKPVLITLGMAIGISLPGVVTHALPMVFVYGWMWLPIALMIHLVYRLVKNSVPESPDVAVEHEYDIRYYHRNHKMYLIKSGGFYLLFRFIAELVAVLFIQTNFNYAIFLYEGTPYFKVIIEEFNSRQFKCIIEMGVKMASLLW